MGGRREAGAGGQGKGVVGEETRSGGGREEGGKGVGGGDGGG